MVCSEVTADDSKWRRIRLGTNVRNKVFWLHHHFLAPENFAGVSTQNREIILACTFTGIGIFEGQFFLDGKLKESFTLEFGNQAKQIKKDFFLTSKAKPEEKMLLAFRFHNLGR